MLGGGGAEVPNGWGFKWPDENFGFVVELEVAWDFGKVGALGIVTGVVVGVAVAGLLVTWGMAATGSRFAPHWSLNRGCSNQSLVLVEGEAAQGRGGNWGHIGVLVTSLGKEKGEVGRDIPTLVKALCAILVLLLGGVLGCVGIGGIGPGGGWGGDLGEVNG